MDRVEALLDWCPNLRLLGPLVSWTHGTRTDEQGRRQMLHTHELDLADLVSELKRRNLAVDVGGDFGMIKREWERNKDPKVYN